MVAVGSQFGPDVLVDADLIGNVSNLCLCQRHPGKQDIHEIRLPLRLRSRTPTKVSRRFETLHLNGDTLSPYPAPSSCFGISFSSPLTPYIFASVSYRARSGSREHNDLRSRSPVNTRLNNDKANYSDFDRK